MTSVPTKVTSILRSVDIKHYKTVRNGICNCKRCNKEFKKGDEIIRVRSSRVQWYHKECYKEF